MSQTLIIITGCIYAYIGIEQFIKGGTGQGIMFLSYAAANAANQSARAIPHPSDIQALLCLRSYTRPNQISRHATCVMPVKIGHPSAINQPLILPICYLG